MSRRLLIAANWKMNPIPEGALDAGSPYWTRSDVDVLVFPTHLDLRRCMDAGLITGAQCARPEPNGAYTGDVNMSMIAACGARYVLCGHSERRAKHGETDEQVAEQARAALQVGLRPIVCVGETPEQRAQERQEQAVREQMENLPLHSIDLTIAYEPVWAIGEKALRAATSQEAQQMHQFIRSLFDPQRRDLVRIIYGGNVNTKNAQGLFDQPDIDGALVGGASLKPIEFQKIVESAAQ